MNSSWHTYPSIFTLGHRALKELFFDDVLVEEKIDGCVSLDTPILRSDLSYVPAGLLRAGDELIGFEDTLNNPHLIRSKVTVAQPIKKPCLDISTSLGNITVSEDHPFLVHQETNHNGKMWVKAKDLKLGAHIVFISRWSHENSWESGYLAGQFDGEGSLVRSGNGRILSYYQKTGNELDLVAKLLSDRSFIYKVDVRKRREDWKNVGSLIFRTDWTEIIRFLGTVRPQRLVNSCTKIWENAPLNGMKHAIIINKKTSRNRLVMGLSTTTKTYIANGMFSHNSQFSFGKFGGELRCRSKGAVINSEYPEKMFSKAVETAKSLDLHDGWTYRGEYLAKPKHNALAYDRTPEKNVILFDINTNEEEYLTYDDKRREAERIGLEVVPILYQGHVDSPEQLLAFLMQTSILGGQKIEGFVVKNYYRFGADKKVLMGKYVSEAFKEVHSKEWKKSNPSNGDILTNIIMALKTEARWNKAVQHLRESGNITDSPKDIGILIKETQEDIIKECKDEIMGRLYAYAKPHILRGVVSGLPEWYKSKLLQNQVFTEDTIGSTTNEPVALEKE